MPPFCIIIFQVNINVVFVCQVGILVECCNRFSSFFSSFKIFFYGNSCCGTAEANPTRNHEVVGSIPALAQWVKDLALLWLWCRLAAVALIRPLAWEPPQAAGTTLKTNKQTNKQKSGELSGIPWKTSKSKHTPFTDELICSIQYYVTCPIDF